MEMEFNKVLVIKNLDRQGDRSKTITYRCITEDGEELIGITRLSLKPKSRGVPYCYVQLRTFKDKVLYIQTVAFRSSTFESIASAALNLHYL